MAATRFVALMKRGSCCKPVILPEGTPGMSLVVGADGNPGWGLAGTPVTNIAKFYCEDASLTANVNYTISHNLALADPNKYMFTARDNVDGSSVEVTIVSSTANALVVSSNVAMASLRFAVVGA